MTSNIIFENHKGVLTHATNEVIFYGIHFKDIVCAAKYLKNVKPDDYEVWQYVDNFGLYKDGYFYLNSTWYNEAAFKELFGIQE